MIAAFSHAKAGSAIVDMCAYNLRRPDNGMLVKKTTLLKGSADVCRGLAAGRCDKKHQHSLIMGTLGPNEQRIRGAVSTWAGGYTREFSSAVLESAEKALWSDLKWLRTLDRSGGQEAKSAFPTSPADDDEGREMKKEM